MEVVLRRVEWRELGKVSRFWNLARRDGVSRHILFYFQRIHAEKHDAAGEYPSNLKEALPELHVSGNAGRFSGPLKYVAGGGPTGLYHLVLGEGQNAFVGNGRCYLHVHDVR
jgi:hypothetical protein